MSDDPIGVEPTTKSTPRRPAADRLTTGVRSRAPKVAISALVFSFLSAIAVPAQPAQSQTRSVSAGEATSSLPISATTFLVHRTCVGCDQRRVDLCADFTSSSELAQICLDQQSDPDITVACYLATRSANAERFCLELQLHPSRVKQCFVHTYSPANELVCLGSSLSAHQIRVCGEFTRDEANEALCLTSAIEPQLVELCYKTSADTEKELQCLENAAAISDRSAR